MLTQSLQPDQMRRQPQQARSQKRVEQIVDAAEQLFAEVGYDATTTNAIAARAQTSIGSLYRFFPDKVAILKALAARYLEQIYHVFAELHTSETLQLPLELYISRTVEAFARFFSSHPSYQAVFLQSRVAAPEVQGMNADLNRKIAGEFATFYTRRNPTLERTQCELMALVVNEVINSLLALSISQDEVFREPIVMETKRLLQAYLHPYL